MLNLEIPASAGAARAYYARADAGDYYAKERGGDYAGSWQGKAAEQLGLSGPASMDDFHALCDNRDPATGGQLSGSNREDRRPLFDLTFSVPKSVAVMRGLFDDKRIERAVMDSVNEVMAGIEAGIKTRVRQDGKNEDRLIGGGVWLPFYHKTSRPVDGKVDPGDHVHACLMNLCYDATEEQWKAIQLDDIWNAAPHWQAVWHANLARKLEGLGFSIERRGDAFEISGVDRSIVEEFSKRSEVIEKTAKRLGITDNDRKAGLAATTREKKLSDPEPEKLQGEWRDRLEPSQLASLEALHAESLKREGKPAPERSDVALGWALEHLLERQSVVTEEKLLTEALKEGLGSASLEGLRHAMSQRADLIRAEVDGVKMVSTRAVIDEEIAVLNFAKDSRGRMEPLNPGGQIRDPILSEEQRLAVRHIWQATDAVILFRGKAGTGKTTTAKEAVRGIEAAGREVLMLAPTAEASRGVLASEGFEHATTVAEFLISGNLQERARGNVVWVDEAGLMPFRDMAKLTQLAESLDARIVLSGDRRQNRAVARGEPLAVLEDLAHLPVAELKTIRRQKGDYRSAVEKLASGQTEKGFAALEQLGAIKDMPESDPYRPLVDAYLEALQEKKSVLALSPTRSEGQVVTEQLRERLKAAGKIGAEDHSVGQLKPLHLTEAEKRDPKRLVGTTAVFVKHSGKFRSGQRVEVTEAIAGQVAAKPDAFAVYEQSTLNLAKGDTIRITANGWSRPEGKAKRGHRLNNGSLYQVKSIGKDGITLNNGWVLPESFGHVSHGYVLTSYAGQGKTFDRVLVAASRKSLAAVNARELYVDASRGREIVTIFTDDQEALRMAAGREEKRLHGLELLRQQEVKAEPPARKAGWKERIVTHLRLMRRVFEHQKRMLEGLRDGRAPQIAR
ncbi:MobF family relaxase [Tautonia sp. JC769]|uniref:MobF family relaxase n=1 Tax=Tautonia sp. JC769 TaxID=3232135 RepID=UPI0034595752